MTERKEADPVGSFGIAKMKRDHDLRSLGDRYLQQFITFRAISSLVEGPPDKQLQFDRMMRESTAMLDEHEDEELRNVLIELASAMAGVVDGELRDPETNEILPNKYQGSKEAQIRINSPEVSAIVSAMVGRTLHHIFAPDKSELIAQAIVGLLVSSFGALIGSVARHSFKVNKVALEKSEHEFTLEELSKYDSIDEARNELINRRVDALLGGGVNDWSSWCKRVLQFDLPSLTSDWPVMREIFARRNIIVHNSGRVNNRYLVAVEDSGVSLPKDTKVGSEVETGKEYVDSSIQRILALGMCLVYSVWRKLYPKQVKEAAKWLVGRQEVMIYDEMWLAAHQISEYLKGAPMKRSDECMSKVYDWLARMQFEGPEPIHQEVVDWDTSGLDVIFVIYKECFFGNVEKVVRLISANQGHSGLSKYDLAMHPIFAEYRAHISSERTVEADVREDREEADQNQ